MAGCWQCDEGELDAVCTCGKGVDVWCDPGGYCCCPDCCGCEEGGEVMGSGIEIEIDD